MAPLIALLGALAIANSVVAAPSQVQPQAQLRDYSDDIRQLIFGSSASNDGQDNVVASWQTVVEKKVAQPAKSTLQDWVDEARLNADHGPPGHPPLEVDFSDYTIWEILEAALKEHHDHPPEHPIPPPGPPPPPPKSPGDLPISKLAWWVNKTDTIKEILDGEDKVSLLAPWDWAIPPFHRGPDHHARPAAWVNFEGDGEGRRHPGPSRDREHGDVHPLAKAYEGQGKTFLHNEEAKAIVEDEDDDRREKFLRIITFILKYAISPEQLTFPVVFNASTIPTLLDGARVRVDTHPSWGWRPIPGPRLETSFNFVSNRRGPVIIAKNGLIHLVDKPLFPPLPAFEQTAIFPSWFSTFTSGLQLTDLDDELKHKHSEGLVSLYQQAGVIRSQAPEELAHLFGEGDDDEAPTGVADVLKELLQEFEDKHGKESGVTVFVPSNRAFRKLGIKINAFLFSPFGHRLLRYVLSYHIVPNVTVYTDYVYNATSTKHIQVDRETNVDLTLPPPPGLAGGCHGRRRHQSDEEAVRSEGGRRHHHPHRSPLRRLRRTIKAIFLRLRSKLQSLRYGSSFAVGPFATGFPWPHPPPPSKGNITHLFLPTLANHTLPIDVFSAEVGPPPHVPGPTGIKRWVVVRPHAIIKEHRKEGEPPVETGDVKVPVRIENAPAWRGAIHIVPEVLLPPKPEPKEKRESRVDEVEEVLGRLLEEMWEREKEELDW